MIETASTLSIGEVARRTGLSSHALRFYEREGILANTVRRDSGGRRVYSEDDVDWLNLCIILRTAGMPVPDIRRYTELVRAGGGNEKERLALMHEHKERVTAQMARLTECMDLIDHKIAVYEDHIDGAQDGCSR